MGISDILRHQIVFATFDFRIFCYHLYASSACCIRWFHNPKVLFRLIFTYHLKSIEITGKYVRSREKIEMLWMLTLQSLQCLVHIIFSTQCPTTWKVVHFLETIHFSVGF
jgi:hypothetical protein